jgi:hypothetical protein
MNCPLLLVEYFSQWAVYSRIRSVREPEMLHLVPKLLSKNEIE